MSKDSLDPRGDLQKSRQIGASDLHTPGLRVFCPVVPRQRDRSSVKDHSGYSSSKCQSSSDLRASSRGSATTPVTDLVH